MGEKKTCTNCKSYIITDILFVMFSLPKNIINEMLSKCIFYYNELLLPQQHNSRKIIFKYSNYNGLLFIQQLYKKEKTTTKQKNYLIY